MNSSFLSSSRRIVSLLLAAAGVLAASARAEVYISVQSATNPALPGLYAPDSSVTFAPISTVTGAIQWLHDGAVIPGKNEAFLTLAHLTPADTGNYQLVLTTASGTEVSNRLAINVLASPPSPVDTTFTAQLPIETSGGYASVAVVLPDNRVVIQRYNQSTSTTLRLNADGTQDASFTPPSGSLSFLAVYPNGTTIMGGPPYRLNPDGSPRALVLPAGFDSTQYLTAAAVQPDGKLLIAQRNHVARLNADDSVDSSFSYATTFAPDHMVLGFGLDTTGRAYVTAQQSNPPSSGYPSLTLAVFRLTTTGAEDTTFARQYPPLMRGGLAIYPLSDGRILRSRSYEGSVFWNMLKEDGTEDLSWIAEVDTFATSYVVDPVNLRIFSIRNSAIRRQLITATTLTDDPTFYPGSGTASSLKLTPSGQILATGSFVQWDGYSAPGLVRLKGDFSVTSLPPTVAIAPESATPTRGSTVTFTSTVKGTEPYTYQWLALDGQALPANTTAPTLVIANFDTANLGEYQLRVTSPSGTVLSNVVRTRYGTSIMQLPYLANISGRAYVGTGDETAIAGFSAKTYFGAGGVSALLRGAGPALSGYGIQAFLPNPTINLYNAASQRIGNNDNWGGSAELQTAFATSGAFPFAIGSNDAAMLSTFRNVASSVQLVDQGNASGVGLVEIYRLPDSGLAEFLNLSLRARTSPGERVATAGFVIVDPQGFGRPLRLMLRVVGPTLANSGVAFPLNDPVLTLYKSTGEVIATNNNWSDNANSAALATTATQVGAFSLPTGSKDAALLLDVPAGVYSIQATNAAGTPDTGVTLIEIYVVR